MDYEEDLEMSDEEIKAADEGGGKPQPGWYIVDVENLSEDDYDHPNLYFHLKVVAPVRHKGFQVKERLWNPKNSVDEKKAANGKTRRGLFAKRLGLTTAGSSRVNWQHAIGKRVLVKLALGQENQAGKRYLQVDWGDIYPLDHPKLPDEARRLLAGQSDAVANTPPPSIPEAVDYGSLL